MDNTIFLPDSHDIGMVLEQLSKDEELRTKQIYALAKEILAHSNYICQQLEQHASNPNSTSHTVP